MSYYFNSNTIPICAYTALFCVIVMGTSNNIKPIGLFCKEVIYHIRKSGLRISFLEMP